MSLALSALDLTLRQHDATASEALAGTVELARRIERLGYRRFWVTEHHTGRSMASTSPAVLISHIASATTTLRLGAGGALLPNHSPLALAEQFATLDVLHPGRIDLGIGRGAGTLDQATVHALRRGRPADTDADYRRDVVELLGYLAGTDPLVPLPDGAGQPEPWLLCSSASGARVAAELGLPVAVAHHIRPHNTDAAVEAYREHFRPSRWLAAPRVLLCVRAVCADSDERATLLRGPMDVLHTELLTGRSVPMPSPAEAVDYPFTDDQRRELDASNASQACGTPDAVMAKLHQLTDSAGADELMLVIPVYDLAERVHSYELIAKHNNQL